MIPRKRLLRTLAGLALLFAGCATTTFTSVWKAPDAQPLQFKAGDKVVALVMAESTGMRRAGEANLADELGKRGLVGVPAYTLISDADIKNEGAAKAAIEASGAVGVVALRPKGTEQKISSTPATYYGGSYYGGPGYGGFWGGGYYGYGWGGAYVPGEIRTDTYVSIETLIYDLVFIKTTNEPFARRQRQPEPATSFLLYIVVCSVNLARQLRLMFASQGVDRSRYLAVRFIIQTAERNAFVQTGFTRGANR